MIDPSNIDLQEFLALWYGPPNRLPSPLPRECDWLPEPLREWHGIISCWTPSPQSVKRMTPPAEIKESEGKAVFMKDPSGDWLWAFDVANKSTIFDAELHGEWSETSEHFPEFLIHNALNETVYGASAWRECTNVHSELLPEILSPMTAVSLGEWRWPTPGGRIFMSDELLAEVSPAMRSSKGAESWEVRVASSDSRHLSYLDSLESVKWMGPR
ncbi:hypothetical protein [Kitasatospora sp. NPDC056181]|uniref:hypothetical protein n=1 Tax=Kitasatospora sp. NPDC056181 TaxID=3345737 RepID=UPI0035DA4F15